MYNTKLVNAATVAAIVMATSPIGAQGFAIPEPASLMSRELGGLNIWKIVDAVRDYLKDKNAYDPSVPDKCALTVKTTDGGKCDSEVQCEMTDKPGKSLGEWNVCEIGKTQYFKHPDLGDLSVTFTEAGGINGNKEDGLHHPALQFKALNNWEQIRVQDIIDAHPGDTGNLCEKKKSNGGRTLEWTCGFPKLTKVSSSAFGINLMNPDSNKKGYAKGWCTAHVIQYQKNEFGTGSDYRFAVQIFDAKKSQIGHVQKAAVDSKRYLGVASKLPYKLVVKAGKVDSDPVSFCYGDQCWTCDKDGGGRHGCTLGRGKSNGFENGDREGDMGFTC